MRHWIYDYECMPNFFCGVFEHYKTDERHEFISHRLLDQFPELVAFLENCRDQDQWHIGFNNLSYDSQLTQYILENKTMLLNTDVDQRNTWLFEHSQKTINKGNNGFKEFPQWSERDLSIRQIDLFKLNHWDNPAKRSSLKWIQYSMDWHNLLDMPIHYTTYITTKDQIDTIMEYCINDVRSTKAIFNRSIELIALRKALTDEYKINLYSASEPRISKELFLHFMSKNTGIKKYDLKQMRTKRTIITVNDIILEYIKFERPEFKQLLNNFRQLTIDANNTKNAFKYSCTYRGVKTDFGLGGLHGANKSGLYQEKDGMIIMSSDVTSFYPNLAIRNKWSPAHLPKAEFTRLYEWFFEERKKIPKKDPKNYVYKIILNSTYGLSNDQNSFLYDPEFTMRITINGQLSLAMLYEMICEGIPEAVPVMQNTDGLETMIPIGKRDKYLEICKKWEDMTMLKLEHDQYQKIILADVNNYLAINQWKEITQEDYEKLEKAIPHGLFKVENHKFYYASTKCKGRFEFSDLALHKNKSFLIIPKALYYYFVHGMIPEKYLQLNKEILDYCAGEKAKGDWTFFEVSIVDGDLNRQELQHTIRYYISDSNRKIVKINKADGRKIELQAGRWMQYEFNSLIKKPWREYKVNESYYLEKIYEEIANIEPVTNQLTLKL
jgi:hypothetical protein